MDPFKALDLLGDLQKTILPAIGAAFGQTDLGDQAGDKDKTVTMGNLLNKKIDVNSALAQLSSAVNGINLSNMLQRILNQDYIAYSPSSGGDAKKLDKAALTAIYQGNLSGMFQLAWQVLRVNYSDFFTMLPSLSGGEPGGKSRT